VGQFGHNVIEFESVGYLVSKDDVTTMIASECDDEEQYRDIVREV
jgi:hypothetical protein